MRYFFASLLAGLLTLSLLPGIASADPAKFTVQTGFKKSTFPDVFIRGNQARGDNVLDFETETQFFEFTFIPTNHFFVSYGREEIEYAPYQHPSLLPGIEIFSYEADTEINRLVAGLILGGRIDLIAGEGQEHRISMDYNETKSKYTVQDLASDRTIIATFSGREPTSYRTNLKYDFARGLGNGYSTAFSFSTQVNNNRDEFVDFLDDRTVSLGVSKSLINNLFISADYSIRRYILYGHSTNENSYGISLGLVY